MIVSSHKPRSRVDVLGSPVAPLPVITPSELIALPAAGFEIAGHPHLIGARPARRLDAERAFKNFTQVGAREPVWPFVLLVSPIIIASVTVVNAAQLLDESRQTSRVGQTKYPAQFGRS